VAFHSDDVSSSESDVEAVEVSLVVLSSSDDLDLCFVSMQIDEDELGASLTERHDPPSERNTLILQEHVLFNLRG
jgi:hypothetical protein